MIFSGDNSKKGSCVLMKPCGFEAACKQLDLDTYRCICPQDNSQPNKDLKCPKRQTGKQFGIFMIFRQGHSLRSKISCTQQTIQNMVDGSSVTTPSYFYMTNKKKCGNFYN